ncbi:MAG: tetratricopeptide repeat protein [Burkholderiaceae bacterium]
MAYDLQEQEEIEGIKAFWNRWGNLLLTVVTVVLLTVAGYMGWQRYQASQAAQAAAVYGQLQQAASAKDLAKVKETAGTIFEKYGGTVYGEMAALLAAKAYLEAGDAKAARAPLQWAADKAKDDEFRQVARVRLAGVLLDEKAYDEALAVLGTAPSEAFAGLFADRRGDVLAAQGKADEARAAYKLALDKTRDGNPLRRLIEVKLEGLGGTGS